MNVVELKHKLDEAGVSQNSYVIADELQGVFVDAILDSDKTILNRIEANKWEVYNYERGEKSEHKIFRSEEKACAYFYKKKMNYLMFLKKHGIE